MAPRRDALDSRCGECGFTAAVLRHSPVRIIVTTAVIFVVPVLIGWAGWSIPVGPSFSQAGAWLFGMPVGLVAGAIALRRLTRYELAMTGVGVHVRGKVTDGDFSWSGISHVARVRTIKGRAWLLDLREAAFVPLPGRRALQRFVVYVSDVDRADNGLSAHLAHLPMPAESAVHL